MTTSMARSASQFADCLQTACLGMFGSVPSGARASGRHQGKCQPCRCPLWLASGLLAPGGDFRLA